MATASHQSRNTTVAGRAQTAIETGIRAFRTVRAYSRPSAVSLAVAFEAGANGRRRRLLQYLATHGETDLSELSEVVAASEHDGETPETISGQRRKRVYVSLYQTHLPKLDQMGLVDYDDDRGIIRLTQSGGDLAEWVDNTAFRFGGGA